MLYLKYIVNLKIKIDMDNLNQFYSQPTDLSVNSPIQPSNTEPTKKVSKTLLLIIVLTLFSICSVFGAWYVSNLKSIKTNESNETNSTSASQPAVFNTPTISQPTESPNVTSKVIFKSDSRNKFSELLFSDNLNGYIIVFTEDKKSCKLISPSYAKDYPCSEIAQQHKIVSDSGQFAFTLPANKYLDKTLVFNGNELGTYRNVQKMSFSTNGNSFAYSAFVVPGEKNVLYLNGKEINATNCTSLVNFFFKPNSEQIDYLCTEGDTKFVIFNGIKQILSTQRNINIPDSIYISPDGTKFAFVKIYYDETPHDPSVPIIPDPYATDHTLTFDNKESKKYKIIHDVTFSQNGKRLAYVGVYRDSARNMISELVVDNKAVKTIANTSSLNFKRDISNISFSPDSKTFVYTIVSVDGQDDLFFNDSSQGKYPLITNFTFSSDSKHFAFIAKKVDSTQNNIFPALESAIESEKNPYPDKVIIVDGKIVKTVSVVSPLKFDQNSKIILYYGFQGTDLWFNGDKVN